MDGKQGKFTGWHATIILVAFFGVVVAVNFTMAALARSTFGGVVVENSYVASQEFNGWLEEARESDALGWQVTLSRVADGRVEVTLAGAPERTRLTGEARHPLGRLANVPLSFVAEPDGSFRSVEALPAGRWTVRLEARDGQALWRAEEDLR